MATAVRNKISGLIEESAAEDAAKEAEMNGLRDQDAAAFDESAPLIVTGYDSNGESKDFEVARIIQGDETVAGEEPHATSVHIRNQTVMPGFEGHVTDEVAVNLSGRIPLNIANPRERAIWEQFRWGERLTIVCDVVVTKRGFQLAMDKDQEDKTRTATAGLKVTSIELFGEDFGRVSVDEWEEPTAEDIAEVLGAEPDAFVVEESPAEAAG